MLVAKPQSVLTVGELIEVLEKVPKQMKVMTASAAYDKPGLDVILLKRKTEPEGFIVRFYNFNYLKGMCKR